MQLSKKLPGCFDTFKNPGIFLQGFLLGCPGLLRFLFLHFPGLGKLRQFLLPGFQRLLRFPGPPGTLLITVIDCLDLIGPFDLSHEYRFLLDLLLLLPAKGKALLRLLQLSKGLLQAPGLLNSVPGFVPQSARFLAFLFCQDLLPLQTFAVCFQVCQKRFQVCHAQGIRFHDPGLKVRQRRKLQPSDLVFADRKKLAERSAFFLCAPGKLLHHIFIESRSKEPPEDRLFLVRACPQKLHEFSLSDHGHLHELAFGKAYDLRKLGVGFLFVLAVLPAVWHQKGYRLHLLFFPFSPFQRPDVPRSTAHRIDLIPFGKLQLHKGRLPLMRKLALELQSVFPVTFGAGFSVKGKDDGVKNGGFSGSRVSGDQKQILIWHPEIYLRLFSVGPEGLHGKLSWPHPIPPPVRC